MQASEFEEYLQQSLGDGHLSRGERQALTERLADAALSDQHKQQFKHVAFELVRRELTSGPMSTIRLDWLEEVIRIIDVAGAKSAIAAARCEARVYFSPGDSCRKRISSLFREARKSVDVCVFTITDNEISSAIIDAHRRGVHVRIITDNDKSLDIGSDIEQLQAAGIDLRLDVSEHHMHHKFALFDGRTVLCGSYNWTRSAADNNEENIVVLDDAGLMDEFQSVFNKLWKMYAP